MAATRRLQLAAKRGRALTCLFRPERAAAGKSMAELRLRLQPDDTGNALVDICKRRGGWPVSGLPLTFDATVPAASEAWLAERLAEWRRVRQPWAGGNSTLIFTSPLTSLSEWRSRLK